MSWRWLGPTPRARFSTGWALLPLRLFLGVTFTFAGLQKLANPNFFNASSPVSIQAQLAGAARRSPIHTLVTPLSHVAIPLGVLIALAEVAVGLGALAGLWTRIAALGGSALSLMLFLTVSFHSSPYYTGSDIVFVFAWLPLVLGGASGVLSADAILENRVRRQMGAEQVAVVPIAFSDVRRMCGSYENGRCQARQGEPCAPAPCPILSERPDRTRRLGVQEIDRRTFVVKGAATGALSMTALLGGGVVAGLGRLAGSSHATSGPTLAGGTGTSTPASTVPTTVPATGPSPGSTTVPTHPRGVRVGPARDVPVGGAATFTDPQSGDPSVVVQPQGGTFLAFDAVCPHAGCTVGYDSVQRLFVCPCHGSEFNGRTGAVEVGPAATGLSRIGIEEGSDGQLYVT